MTSFGIDWYSQAWIFLEVLTHLAAREEFFSGSGRSMFWSRNRCKESWRRILVASSSQMSNIECLPPSPVQRMENKFLRSISDLSNGASIRGVCNKIVIIVSCCTTSGKGRVLKSGHLGCSMNLSSNPFEIRCPLIWYLHVCSSWIPVLAGFYTFVESVVDGAEYGSTIEDKSPRAIYPKTICYMYYLRIIESTEMITEES